MKNLFTTIFCIRAIMFATVKYVKAQDGTADPGTYMNTITNAETGMNKTYMAYISASAHNSHKRKVEKLREKTVESIINCQNTISNLSPYKGDNSLRQKSLDYVQLCYKIFNEDYAHIVNMDDIAERSFDEMQAYLLLQQATNDTLQMAIQRINKTNLSFAVKYNVNIINQKTELGDKMEETNIMTAYHDKVYLLFYKCNWEDNQLTDAINQKNVTKIDQMRNALDKFAKEGLNVLDTMKDFKNDASLRDACKQALIFYKTEAETQVPMLTDYYLKEENFGKVKSTFDLKPANERTRQDVDIYNKGVSDMNNAVNTFNQTNNDLNNGRGQVNNNWMNTDRQFVDAHTPYYQ